MHPVFLYVLPFGRTFGDTSFWPLYFIILDYFGRFHVPAKFEMPQKLLGVEHGLDKFGFFIANPI